MEPSSTKLYFSNFKLEHCAVFIQVCVSPLVSTVWRNRGAMFSCLERGFPWHIAKYTSNQVILHLRKLTFRTVIVLLWFDFLPSTFLGRLKCLYSKVFRNKPFLINSKHYISWVPQLWNLAIGLNVGTRNEDLWILDKTSNKDPWLSTKCLVPPVSQRNPQNPPSVLRFAPHCPLQWKTLIHGLKKKEERSPE